MKPPGTPSPSFERLARRTWVRLQQQFWYYLLHFVEGDHNWGQMRLTLAAVAVVVFVIFSRLFEPITSLPLLHWMIDPMGLPELLPAPALRLLEFGASFLTRQTLRHALPPLAGIAVALYFGATYLRNLLELPNLQLAFKYLTATLFGSDYPHMTIAQGKATVDDPETNPMLKIGGPGWVHIKIGSAAIFERVVGPSQVLGAGTHFIRRFETLRETFDLREIERSRSDIRLVTRDGVPIVLNEFRVRFRIRAREVRTEANPYPVMVGAIRRAAYNRRVSARGLEDWADMVTGTARGTITGWLARRRMDELIPPPAGTDPAPDPAGTGPLPYRKALHDLFQQKDTRQKFADLGAEIIWVSVGHVRPDPDVDPELQTGDATGHDRIHQQMIDTWRATQAARAQDEIADARAYARWLNDTARTQAECDLILALTAGLRQAREDGMPLDETITNRLLEHITGVRLRSTDGGLQPLLALSSLIQTSNPPEAGNLLPGGE